MNSKIIFLKVATNQNKLFSLTKVIQKQFDLNEHILIFVPTNEVAQYIDQLIWRLPQESFIPHIVSDTPCNNPVVITSKNENLNKATVLINLSQNVNTNFHEFHTVYELYDMTHPSKEELSKARHLSYSERGFHVTTQSI